MVLPTHGSGAVVAVQLWITGGTALEEPTEHGCAHLLEHMLFKPNAGGGDLATDIEGLGGDINAFTSHDETVVHATVPAGREDEAIDALLSSVLQPVFDADALALEREVVVEEIRQYRDDPGSRATQALMEALYGRHPYARPVLGTIATVRSHDAARLRRFHRRIYGATRAHLVVVGPVDPDAVVARAQPWLEALPRGAKGLVVPPVVRPLGRPRLRVRAAEVHEAHVQLAWRAPPVPCAEACALEVASIVLGYGEASRLNRRVRRSEQLVTDVVASFFPSRVGSALVISAHVETSRVEAAVAAIVSEVEAMCRAPLLDEELSRARTVLASDLVYRRETAAGHAHALGYNLSLAGSLDLDARYYAALEDLSVATVRSLCATWLRTGSTAASVVVPKGTDTAALRRALGARVRKAPARARRTTIRRDRHGVQSVTFPGGLRLLASVDRRVPMAAGWVLWPGGLRREDARRNGSSAMMARLLTRGCAAIDGDDLAQEVEGAAASLDGFSSRNSTGLHFECMADSVPLVLRRAVECALAPRFDPDELDEERRVLRQELAAEQDEPAKMAFRMAYERLYRGHPYRWRRQGSEASLARQTSKGLQRTWARWYPLGRAVLSICGDVDVDGLVGMLDELLADVEPAAPLPDWPGRPPRHPARPVELRRSQPREQAHLVMAMPGLPFTDRAVPTLDVLMAVLGGQAGRLFLALREAEGLVYHVSASSTEGLDTGDLTVYAAASPGRFARAREVLEAELARVCDELVEDEELSRAKALIHGQYVIGMERHGRVASQLAYNEAFGLPRHDHLRYPARIDRVSAKAVRTLARRMLDPRRRVVAIVGP